MSCNTLLSFLTYIVVFLTRAGSVIELFWWSSLQIHLLESFRHRLKVNWIPAWMTCKTWQKMGHLRLDIDLKVKYFTFIQLRRNYDQFFWLITFISGNTNNYNTSLIHRREINCQSRLLRPTKRLCMTPDTCISMITQKQMSKQMSSKPGRTCLRKKEIHK